MADPTPTGTMACPICGRAQPHAHHQEEIATWLRAQAARFGYGVSLGLYRLDFGPLEGDVPWLASKAVQILQESANRQTSLHGLEDDDTRDVLAAITLLLSERQQLRARIAPPDAAGEP